MSVTLSVYSPLPVLGREALAQAFRHGGLPPGLRREIVFLPDHRGTEDPAGLVPSGHVLGWSPESADAGRIRDAIARNDRRALDELFGRDAFGSVELTVRVPSDEDWQTLTEAEFLEAIPREHQGAIRAARSWYTIETHASRNPPSLALQEQLWRMIGVLGEGLMEDPQQGEFTRAGKGEAPSNPAVPRPLRTTRAPNTLRRLNLAAFVVAAAMAVGLGIYEMRRPRVDLAAVQARIASIATKEEALSHADRLARAVKAADNGLHRWRRIAAWAWATAAFVFLWNLTLIRDGDAEED